MSSYAPSFGLALPASGSSSANLSGSASFQSSPGPSPKVQKRPRKPKVGHRPSRAGGLDLERALDENDDIDIDKDLEAAPGRRARAGRELDEDYDEDEEEDNDSEEEERAERDGEGEADADGEEDGRANGDQTGGEGEERENVNRRGEARKGKGKAKEVEPEPDVSEMLKRKRERLGQVEVDGKEVDRRNKKRKEESYLLRNQMDPEQARRFDAFSTVVLPKQAIKRLNREMFDQSCSVNLAAIIAGLGKVFVAEVVEIAKDLQPTSKYPTGPLRPYHLRLARMELEQRGLLSPNGGGATRGGSALRPRKAIFRR